MTTAPADLPPVAPTNQPHIVLASQGTRLEQLHASYADLKAAADEADKRLKGVTAAIKAELAAAEPGQERVELRSPVGPPLRMSYVESWRMDTKRIKAERPDIYATFAVKSGSWQLRAVAGSDHE